MNISAGDLNTIKVCRLLVLEIFKDSNMLPEKLALSIKACVAMYIPLFFVLHFSLLTLS